MEQPYTHLPISKARQALTHLEDLPMFSSLLITRRNKPFARLELLVNREQLFQKALGLIEALPSAKSRKRQVARNYKKYLGR